MKQQTGSTKKELNIFTIFLLILSFSLICLTNIIIDKYSIFRGDYSRKFPQPNIRYAKVKHVLNNPTKYDSFLFGSSKTGYLNATQLKDGKYYNLYMPLLTPQESLKYLNLFINRGIKIKNVMLFIESDYIKTKTNVDEPLIANHPRYLYYPVTLKQKLVFYKTYLLQNPFQKEGKESPFDGYSTFDSGSWAQYHPKNELTLNTKKITKVHYNHNPYNFETLKFIKEFVETCEKNNIKLTIAIFPERVSTYKISDVPTYNRVKVELAKIHPYYDFSGINKYTTDDRYSYDEKHFNLYTGAKILEIITEQPDQKSPLEDGFGAYVTKENVQQHILNLCKKTPEIKECIPGQKL